MKSPNKIDSEKKIYHMICDKNTKYPFGLSLLCLRLCFFFFLSAFLWLVAFPVGLVHCSQDPQTSFFNKTFIKNGSHGTIHTFKNYFTTVFSVFSKISCRVTNCSPHLDGNRRWAQQAKYNKFVREWVKELG